MMEDMSTIMAQPRSLEERLAEHISEQRRARGWSVVELAERSGVSRAMISKIERGEAMPTASLLAKLSVAFGVPLSQLFAEVESAPTRVSRAAERTWWKDPETGYRRRAVSPPRDTLLQLTEAELPPGARVPFTAATYTFIHQQIWVIDGKLTFREGHDVHELSPGDCLMLGPPQDCVFENAGRKTCRYVVAVVKR
jgi:transcriptional regulator with XRE-family HTH domain